MNNVINFQAAVNARRVAADRAAYDAAAAERSMNQKIAIAGDLVDNLGVGMREAAFVAHEMVEKAEALKAAKYQPAYCDPANEFKGSKYAATRDLDIKEVAKRMRDDIKALKLRAGFKVAVRIQRFSGGQSIDVRVSSVPADFVFWSDAYASWYKQFGDNHSHRFPGRGGEQKSAEYASVEERLKEIHDSYNRDNSDSSSDYFNVRYYGDVNFDGAWAALKVEAAANAGNYWAADSI
jgi:hypothetical protein